MKNAFRSAAFHVSAVLFFCLFTALPLISYGQVVAEDSLKVQLNEIKVEAAYSSINIAEAPLSLSYLIRGSHDMTSRPAATLDELAYTLPGVFISDRQNYALGERMTIRGLGWRSQFGVRGVQVLLDDMPLTVADGQTIMNMADPAMVKRIELLRGPSSTFWGNSSGGVLYMSTIPRTGAPLVQYRGYAGSYNTLKQEVQLNARTESGRLYGYATYFDTEGYREHSAARMIRASLGNDYYLSPGSTLSFRVAYAGMPKAQSPGSLTEADAEESPTNARQNFVDSSAGKQFDQLMAYGSWLKEYSSGLLNIAIHGTYRDLSNPLPFGEIGLDRRAGGARATYEFDNLSFDLHTGAEIKIQDDDRLETSPSGTVVVDQNEVVVNQALFLRTGVSLSDRLKASGGLRLDRLKFRADQALLPDLEGDRTFLALNPSVGLSYLYGQGQIFANFSTAFESPTTVELVNRPDGGGGFNENLDPERTVSLESGVRGRSESFSYDVTLFGMRVNNLIVPFQLSDDGPTFFRNEGRTLHYGLETGLFYQPTAMISARAMLTLLNAQFDEGEFDGNDVPGVANFRFGSGLTLSPGRHSFSVDNEWVGRYTVNSENTASNDPYALFHFRWSYETDRLS
ncbi:MAG: TonB-dependent receptor, partial [Balneolaceae bacterium]|nr:TonB-dependent receptor [Balneolaceae bacterium]